jgi:hypothetical protein
MTVEDWLFRQDLLVRGQKPEAGITSKLLRTWPDLCQFSPGQD